MNTEKLADSDPQENSKRESEVQVRGNVEDQPLYSDFNKKRRIIIILIVTFAGLLGPVAGNIYIPILPELEKVFNVAQTTINGTVSVFMGVFAFAPLLWSSWADFGGRKTLYLISIAIFIVANLVLAVIPPHIASLYIFRIIQAFGASSVISLGAGTIADIIEPRSRAKAVSYFMLGPQIGPILGPLFSLIGTKGGWRWIFGFLAIFGGLVYLFILFLLPETLRYLVGNGECYGDKPWLVKPRFIQKRITDLEYPKPPKPSLKSLWQLLTYKPVFICSIVSGLLFASFYALIVSFGRVLQEKYKYSTVAVIIAYLCPGVSLISGSIISGYLSDYLRSRKEKKHIKTIPEDRFSTMVYGLVLSTIGITCFGWMAQFSINVISIFVFTFLSGFGMTWVFVISTTYLTESSPARPATNVAIGNMMRNLAAAISSAIIQVLINAMGYGWCFTGLGIINVVGIVFSLVIIKGGAKWREEYDNKQLVKEVADEHTG